MVDERERHFDPELLDLFVGSLADMVAIRDANLDPVPDRAEITVLAVDSRSMFADALVRLLAQEEGISVVAVGTTATQALKNQVVLSAPGQQDWRKTPNG